MTTAPKQADIQQPAATADERKKAAGVRFRKLHKAVEALNALYQSNPETTEGFNLARVIEEAAYMEFSNVKNNEETRGKLKTALNKAGVNYRLMHYPTGEKITVILTQVGNLTPVKP